MAVMVRAVRGLPLGKSTDRRRSGARVSAGAVHFPRNNEAERDDNMGVAMATKRRGGQKSGSYPRLGTTPGAGIPAPNMNDVLSAMAAQLDAFSQEVRELKGLIKELRAPAVSARPVGGETTESLDVASFRRARRQRTVLLTAALMVPLMLLAMWGMWPANPPHQAKPAVSNVSVAKSTVTAPTPVPAPPPMVVQAVPLPPAPVSVQPSARVAVPKREASVAAPPIQTEFSDLAAPARPVRTAPVHNDQEHSGGAPILD